MCVRFRAGARVMSTQVFKWFTSCVCARVREGLINNVSSKIHIVYYVIVTERKALLDEYAKK